jgi:hypothetical protein
MIGREVVVQVDYRYIVTRQQLNIGATVRFGLRNARHGPNVNKHYRPLMLLLALKFKVVTGPSARKSSMYVLQVNLARKLRHRHKQNLTRGQTCLNRTGPIVICHSKSSVVRFWLCAAQKTGSRQN